MMRIPLRAMLLAATILAFGAPTVSSANPPPYTPSRVVLGNCYVIKFVGFFYDNYGNSIWKYRVKEKDGCKDLSNWVLELPGCKVIWAKPEPSEVVVDEPHTHLAGVKWETGDGFKYGLFKVKVKGQPPIGVVEVAAKSGQGVFYGEIAGPVCNDYS